MKIYKIQTRSGTFRRAGRPFSPIVTEIPESDLAEEQITALENEPRLIVTVSEIEDTREEDPSDPESSEKGKKTTTQKTAKKTGAK